MKLDIEQTLLFGMLTASLHWLIARAEITRPLWSRARGWLATLLGCPACSGFWIGGALAASGLSVPIALESHALSLISDAVLALFLTPVFEGLLVWGLRMSAMIDTEEPPTDTLYMDEAPTPPPLQRP